MAGQGVGDHLQLSRGDALGIDVRQDASHGSFQTLILREESRRKPAAAIVRRTLPLALAEEVSHALCFDRAVVTTPKAGPSLRHPHGFLIAGPTLGGGHEQLQHVARMSLAPVMGLRRLRLLNVADSMQSFRAAWHGPHAVSRPFAEPDHSTAPTVPRRPFV